MWGSAIPKLPDVTITWSSFRKDKKSINRDFPGYFDSLVWRQFRDTLRRKIRIFLGIMFCSLWDVFGSRLKILHVPSGSSWPLFKCTFSMNKYNHKKLQNKKLSELLKPLALLILSPITPAFDNTSLYLNISYTYA